VAQHLPLRLSASRLAWHDSDLRLIFSRHTVIEKFT
jgi:hypothetical protein